MFFHRYIYIWPILLFKSMNDRFDWVFNNIQNGETIRFYTPVIIFNTSSLTHRIGYINYHTYIARKSIHSIRGIKGYHDVILFQFYVSFYFIWFFFNFFFILNIWYFLKFGVFHFHFLSIILVWVLLIYFSEIFII